MTAADCAAVNTMIVATEMELDPTHAPAPDIAPCSRGQTQTMIFNDDFEAASNPNWSASAVSGTTQSWQTHPNPLVGPYATSGIGAATNYNNGAGAEESFSQNASVTLPANSFVHFRHAYDLVDPLDAGLVEYSTNNGTTWQSAAPLFSFNGPATIVNHGPLSGEQAYGGYTNGFTASRLNVASLAGQSVRFRFRVSLSEFSAVRTFIWAIDDFAIYTCSGQLTPSAPTIVVNRNVLVQQGRSTSSVIGRTFDDIDRAGTLSVTPAGMPAGLAIEIQNQAGILTAAINCACTTPLGTYPITLTVRDSDNLMASTVVTVTLEMAGEQIHDGGFESPFIWETFSSANNTLSPPLCSSQSCLGFSHTGDGWLQFGSEFGTSDEAYAQQSFTTTFNSSVTLEFYLMIFAHNGRGTHDYIEVRIDGISVFRATDANTTYDDSYRKISIPLANLSAGQHTLRIDAVTNSETQVIRFNVDDISLKTNLHQCRGSNMYLPSVMK